jgi:L-asparaginase
MALAKVVLLGTGGTIASRIDQARGNVTAAATGDELMATMASRGFDLPDAVSVETEQFCNVGSFLFDLDLAFGLAQRIAQRLSEPDVAGVVVTHGTDTMEESAYLADLVVDTDKPIVFTGAQRHADEPDSDGPRNLMDAIRVASSPEARGLGAVILFEQEIHAARDATKLHASRAGTFQSAEHGKLGEVDRGRVVVQRRPLLRRHFPTERVEPRIDLVKLVMGSDARFMRCALETGARGIVLEAFGRGNANHAILGEMEAARSMGIPVVVSSRCPQGRVEPIYGDGGGKDVAAAGGIFAGDLSGIKARVLLSVLLGHPGCADVGAAVGSVAG